MANHLRPLFITTNFGGIPIPKVMVDDGATINLLSHSLLAKMGLIGNFARGITKTHGILDVDVIVGTKMLKIAFFVVDTTSTTNNALHPLQEINLGTEEDSRPTFVSALQEEPLKSEIIALLHYFRDCFAWHYHEMPGLDRELVEHKLPIKEGYLLVKQARRRMSMEIELKVKEEIKRLVKAGFIRPAIYADGLSNIIPALKRKTGAVRIYMDYRNLNEASPRDEYPMPMADMLVDGAAHNQMLSFMDGNTWYNQIMVAEEDIHKTAFMCPGHIGATYQRAMNSVFHDMTGHSLEV
ncbi:unnamed protein product [Prunus brigantina]